MAMLSVGDRAPDFTLNDQFGSAVSLTHLLKQGELILYFYPADFTPVCTAEACAFRDRFDDLKTIDTQLVGINAQDETMHRDFTEVFSLPFPLLHDVGKTVIRAYGVEGPLGFSVRRATFRIGRDQLIKNRVVSDIAVNSHMELIQSVLAERSA